MGGLQIYHGAALELKANLIAKDKNEIPVILSNLIHECSDDELQIYKAGLSKKFRDIF